MDDLLALYQKLDSISFSYDKENTKQLCFNQTDDIIKLLNEYNIDGEAKGGQLCVDREKLPFSYFEEELEFRKEINPSFLSKPCVIKNEDSGFFWFDCETKTTINESGEVQHDVFLFTNSQVYFRFTEFLKKESLHSDGEFEFTDFYSETTRKITLTSFTEKKRVTFNKPLAGIPLLSSTEDYRNSYSEFEKLYIESPHYPIFLKNAIINRLYDVQEDRFKAFFSQLPKIIKDARVNFGVHLHSLSLDNIVQEYKEYKQKYYESHSQILSKISSHILALPLSVAGSAFALYKLKESSFGLLLIAVAFVFFCIYFTNLIRIYYLDIKDISTTIKRDFIILSGEPFFKENPLELEEFTKAKNNLDVKSERLISTLKFFLAIVWTLNLALIVYSIHLLDIATGVVGKLGLFSIGMLIYAYIKSYIIFKDDD